MHLAYGAACVSADETQRIYHERYTNRTLLSRQMFVNIIQRLRDANMHDMGRPRQAQAPTACTHWRATAIMQHLAALQPQRGAMLGLSYTNHARCDPSECCEHVKSMPVQIRQPCSVMNDAACEALLVYSATMVTNLFKKSLGSELVVLKSQQISDQCKNFTRMSPTTFEDLLIKIGLAICKEETHLREPISIQVRGVFY
ncbi:hypothetical protein PR048_032947 [Dryococelus australis]|uniref:DUF4817 domain-containing protein n=1 Tax=Dryococelus australis TaxID=614101 RepID=A0ABQ9G3N6_9NEOP|nr:hypothetical protein PR048_032947 [Dryococelus australis]